MTANTTTDVLHLQTSEMSSQWISDSEEVRGPDTANFTNMLIIPPPKNKTNLKNVEFAVKNYLCVLSKNRATLEDIVTM